MIISVSSIFYNNLATICLMYAAYVWNAVAIDWYSMI